MEISKEQYIKLAKDGIGKNDILYCPACGKCSLWQKPSNHRKYVCDKCGKESIIIPPSKVRKWMY